MKKENLKDLMTLGVFVAIAYFAVSYYNVKRKRERERIETLHFQLF